MNISPVGPYQRQSPLFRARRIGILLGSVLLVLVGACGDDDPPLDRLDIHLVSSVDSSPIGPATVSIFDLVESRYVASFDVGSDGHLIYRPEVAGEFVPVVRASGMSVFGMPQTRFVLRRTGRTVVATIPMGPGGTVVDFGLSLSGRVVDATTGSPIAHAQVEMTSIDVPQATFSEFAGTMSEVEPITDADGAFEIDKVPLMQVSPTEDLVTLGLRVRASGYRSFVHPGWTRSEFPGQIVVQLEPGEDDGVITGRVVSPFGVPVAGVPVRIEWRSGTDDLFGSLDSNDAFAPDVQSTSAILMDSRGISDANGRFRLENLPRGQFSLRAGVEPDDGFWSPGGSSGRVGVRLDADSTQIDAGDVIAAAALELLSPPSGVDLPLDAPLSWKPYPGAVSYSVNFSRGSGGAAGVVLDSTALDLSEASNFFRTGMWYRWYVWALDESGAALSGAERSRVFRLTDPSTSKR